MSQQLSIKIDKHFIGIDHSPFIVAEMPWNYNLSLGRALKIVGAAAQSGFHALKLQTFTPDIISLNINIGEFFFNDSDNL